MPKPKGSPKTPGSGRKKGSLNYKTRGILEACAELGLQPAEVMVLMAGDKMHPKQFEALKEVCSYLWAKKRALEVSGPDGEPIDVNNQLDEESLANLEKVLEKSYGKTS